jgi:hypothetical protein
VDMEHLRRDYMKAHPHAHAAEGGEVQSSTLRSRPEGTHAHAEGVQRRKS